MGKGLPCLCAGKCLRVVFALQSSAPACSSLFGAGGGARQKEGKRYNRASARRGVYESCESLTSFGSAMVPMRSSAS
eukprot:310331-Pyramimonas_sp.AAC.1